MNGKQAILRVFELLERGVQGAIVIRDGDGYDVIPKAYLSDISYTEDPEIVTSIQDDGDFGSDFDLSDRDSWEEVAEWAAGEWLDEN